MEELETGHFDLVIGADLVYPEEVKGRSFFVPLVASLFFTPYFFTTKILQNVATENENDASPLRPSKMSHDSGGEKCFEKVLFIIEGFARSGCRC